MNESYVNTIYTYIDTVVTDQELSNFRDLIINNDAKALKIRFKFLLITGSYDNNLKPQITKISQTGLVTVEFGKSVAIPRSYLSFNDAVFSIGVIKKVQTVSSTSKRNLAYQRVEYQNFKITSFN